MVVRRCGMCNGTTLSCSLLLYRTSENVCKHVTWAQYTTCAVKTERDKVAAEYAELMDCQEPRRDPADTDTGPSRPRYLHGFRKDFALSRWKAARTQTQIWSRLGIRARTACFGVGPSRPQVPRLCFPEARYLHSWTKSPARLCVVGGGRDGRLSAIAVRCSHER